MKQIVRVCWRLKHFGRADFCAQANEAGRPACIPQQAVCLRCVLVIKVRTSDPLNVYYKERAKGQLTFFCDKIKNCSEQTSKRSSLRYGGRTARPKDYAHRNVNSRLSLRAYQLPVTSYQSERRLIRPYITIPYHTIPYHTIPCD